MTGQQLMDREVWRRYGLSNFSTVLEATRLRSSFAVAFLAGALFLLESPAQAVPKITKDSFQLAQVGITSQINGPIPLNLKPRTHIPLPTDSRSREDDYSSGYDDGYVDGYRDSAEDGYHHNRDYYHGYHRDRDRQRKDTVIIINPATSTTYESYGNYDRDNNPRGYIRIIRNKASF
jgi:hypothetical protein